VGTAPLTLTETSGIAASRRHPGVIYAHNDSGDGPYVVAITTQGEVVATLELTGASSEDWEDIAAGPGPDASASYVFVGDFGDNFAARRDGVRVHRFGEPPALDAGKRGVIVVEHATFVLRYPGGPRDAEALLVDPAKGDLYVITKGREGSPELYVASAPLDEERATELVLAGSLEACIVPARGLTAADISADGRLILARTYAEALLFPRAPSQTIAEALAQAPCRVPVAPEAQGESIAFSADGRAYFTVSEGMGAGIFEVGFGR
jgi:hypothetical protein